MQQLLHAFLFIAASQNQLLNYCYALVDLLRFK